MILAVNEHPSWGELIGWPLTMVATIRPFDVDIWLVAILPLGFPTEILSAAQHALVHSEPSTLSYSNLFAVVVLNRGCSFPSLLRLPLTNSVVVTWCLSQFSRVEFRPACYLSALRRERNIVADLTLPSPTSSNNPSLSITVQHKASFVVKTVSCKLNSLNEHRNINC